MPQQWAQDENFPSHTCLRDCKILLFELFQISVFLNTLIIYYVKVINKFVRNSDEQICELLLTVTSCRLKILSL